MQFNSIYKFNILFIISLIFISCNNESAKIPNVKNEEAQMSKRPLYDEELRPQFHFSPKENWTNDPNGMVYYKGTYHLFFQHNHQLQNQKQ